MDLPRFGPGGRFATRRLGPPDIAALQQLFERAADYFETVTGAPPGPDEGERAFVGGPPSKAVSDKLTIGVFGADRRLVGVLDAIPDFPVDGTCTIGLLLLDPGERGHGLGTMLLDAFEHRMAADGTTTFRTAVVSHHERGIAFCTRQGYAVASRLEGYAAGARPATVLFYEKAVRRLGG